MILQVGLGIFSCKWMHSLRKSSILHKRVSHLLHLELLSIGSCFLSRTVHSSEKFALVKKVCLPLFSYENTPASKELQPTWSSAVHPTIEIHRHSFRAHQMLVCFANFDSVPLAEGFRSVHVTYNLIVSSILCLWFICNWSPRQSLCSRRSS